MFGRRKSTQVKDEICLRWHNLERIQNATDWLCKVGEIDEVFSLNANANASMMPLPCFSASVEIVVAFEQSDDGNQETSEIATTVRDTLNRVTTVVHALRFRYPQQI